MHTSQRRRQLLCVVFAIHDQFGHGRRRCLGNLVMRQFGTIPHGKNTSKRHIKEIVKRLLVVCSLDDLLRVVGNVTLQL